MERRDFMKLGGMAAGSLLLPLSGIAVSAGIGIRVIAKGTWGFASTSDMSPDSIQKTAEIAVAVAMANGANFINSSLFIVNEQKYFAVH
jgi:predicted Zn-dependent protease